VQVEYLARTLLAPIIDQRASVIEVKASAEDQWVSGVHGQLTGSVFSAGCSNWYINEYGRNAASWPGYASTFWKQTLIPRYGVFRKRGGSSMWPVWTLIRWVRTKKTLRYAMLVLVIISSSKVARTSIQSGSNAVSRRLHELVTPWFAHQ
jgi:hypothetical protein